MKKLVFFWACLFLAIRCSGGTIYVDADAPGTNDGSSWENAYNFLQDALSDAGLAEKPVEIKVAQGVYRPDQGAGQTAGDRTATFQLIDNVAVKGGYAGFDEPDPNARDIELYETILSGDLNGDDIDVADPYDLLDEPSRADNSYHVVTATEVGATASLDGFTVTAGNTPGGCGGGMNASSNPLVTNCTFIANSADGGGALMCGRSTFTYCNFIGNAASTYGGALYNDCGRPILRHCFFRDNVCEYRGGAIESYEAGLTMEHCTFTGNSSQVGGAMSQHCTDALLRHCRFVGNSAETGGAIEDNGFGESRLQGCSFIGNTAAVAGGYYVTTGSTPTLFSCTFSQNSAEEKGGGIGVLGNNGRSPTLVDCLFSDNRAARGAGIFNGYEVDSTLTDCRFVGNDARYGAGMYNCDCNPTLFRCRFTANSAEEDGGAIYNLEDEAPYCKPTLVNCAFYGNRAGRYGGAIYNYALQDQCGGVLTNCSFSGNSAVDGKAMAFDSIDAQHPGDVILTQCILWDGALSVWNNDGSTISISYSDVECGWPGRGNVALDPCFADAGYWDPNGTPDDVNDDFWVDGDYHLKSQSGRWDGTEGRWTKDEVTSPCIDAGDWMSPIGTEPFPNGGRINMGAYGGTAESSKSYFGKPVCETIVAGDVNGDCITDFKDFSIMALHWLDDNNP